MFPTDEHREIHAKKHKKCSPHSNKMLRIDNRQLLPYNTVYNKHYIYMQLWNDAEELFKKTKEGDCVSL